MKINVPHIILLLVCIISRLLTSIYYIEDPESLKLSLSVFEYNPQISQPGFPGYFLFCYVLKALYFLTESLSLAFSILGGIAVYFIIVFSTKLLKVPLLSLEGVLTGVLLFFNPLIWLTSNSFTPDLAGAALMLGAFYYLMADHYNYKNVFPGWVLAGLLLSVKPVFFLFLLIPCIYAVANNAKPHFALFFLFSGTLIGLLPYVISLGISDFQQILSQQKEILIQTADKSLNGSAITGKMVFFLKSIWAYGLGAFWPGRWIFMILNSLGVIACIVFGGFILFNFDFPRSKIYVLAGSAFIYIGSIVLFYNKAPFERSVLVFIPFLIIVMSYGIIYFLVNFNSIITKILMFIFLVSYITITVYLTLEHKKPTAIAQVKNYLEERGYSDLKIISEPVINEYLIQQGIQATYYLREGKEKIKKSSVKVLVIEGEDKITVPLINAKNKFSFHHNPYVNSYMADIMLYEY